jgi:hypothetical protein
VRYRVNSHVDYVGTLFGATRITAGPSAYLALRSFLGVWMFLDRRHLASGLEGFVMVVRGPRESLIATSWRLPEADVIPHNLLFPAARQTSQRSPETGELR